MIKSTPLLFFMLKSCLLLGASAIGASTASHADLYYWTAADGSLMATDQQPPAGVEFRTQRDLQNINQWQQTTSEKPAATETAADAQDADTDLMTVKLSPNAPPQEMPAVKKPNAENSVAKNDGITGKTKTADEPNPEQLSIGAVSKTGGAAAAELTAANLQPDDEAGCQKLYGVNCDKVFNWRKYGEQYCADFKNERCSDAGWFERRFKPLTLEERHKRTLRNAAARNRDNEEIRHYLYRKYTGVCANDPAKAPTLCNNAFYEAKILNTFNQLNGKDQAKIKHLQQVLKTSKDRNLTDRAIEEFLSYLPLATAASGL